MDSARINCIVRFLFARYGGNQEGGKDMWKEIIYTVLVAVIMTLVFIAFRRALEVIRELLVSSRAKAQEADNKAAVSAYDLAITVLDSVAKITVSRMEATQAAAVRKAVKSGEKAFTELTKCGEEAYQDIVAQLSPFVMASLETCVSDTERLIRNKIEEVLPGVKKEYRELEEQETEEISWELDTEGSGQ